MSDTADSLAKSAARKPPVAFFCGLLRSGTGPRRHQNLQPIIASRGAHLFQQTAANGDWLPATAEPWADDHDASLLSPLFTLAWEGIARMRNLWFASESLIGLLATFIIGFFPVGILIPLFCFCIAEKHWSWALLILGVFPLAVFVAGNLIAMSARVVNRQGSIWPPSVRVSTEWAWHRQAHETDDGRERPEPVPLAVAMARELRPLPFTVGLPLSVWWLAHFVAALLLGHLAVRLIAAALLRPGVGPFFIVGVALHFALLFAANLYLLLAVAVLIRREGVQHGLWKHRVFIDALLALGSMCVILYSN